MVDRIEVDAVVETRFLVRHSRVVDTCGGEGWAGFLLIRVALGGASPARADCGSRSIGRQRQPP